MSEDPILPRRLPYVDCEFDNTIKWLHLTGFVIFMTFLNAGMANVLNLSDPWAIVINITSLLIVWPHIFRPDVYVLQAPWEMLIKGHKHTIQAGYRFDGASIPRCFWSMTGFTPYGRHLAAALEHDRLCELKGLVDTDDGQLVSLSFVEVHSHFMEQLIAWKVRPTKVVIMSVAVYVFGPKWIKRKVS